MAYRKKTHKKNKAEVIDHKPDEKPVDKPTAVRVVADEIVEREAGNYPKWTGKVFDIAGPIGGFGLWAIIMVILWPMLLSVGSAAMTFIAIQIVGGYPDLVIGEMGTKAPTMMPVIFLTVFTALIFAWVFILGVKKLGQLSMYLARGLFLARDRHARKARKLEKAAERKREGERIAAKKKKEKTDKVKAKQQVADAKQDNPDL